MSSLTAQASGSHAVPEPVDASRGDSPTYQEGAIEVDSDILTDRDSAYDDEISTYTTSLTPSVTDFPEENGRRYHAFRAGSEWTQSPDGGDIADMLGYMLPNDEAEQDRLDLMHHLLRLRLDQKLHLAPIGKNPQRILDIGTGTGIWAIEIGDMYPSAEVLGNDLSPIQPRMVPPNVRFEVDDVESDWTFNTAFDFIHCRNMAVSIADWPRLVGQAYKHTAPGGWAEFQDFDYRYYSDDGTLLPSSAVGKWDVQVLEGAYKIGRDPSPGPKLESWIRDAGFQDVKHEVYKLPIGPWAKDKRLKEIGAFNHVNILDALQAVTLALFTRVLGWSAEEVEVLLAGVRRDLKNPRIHAYYNL
ncbi:hypothetical protein MMC16_001035 [Acarospora aff. strigata]|nr:hypothetical protein [Acarospora aff. strigata]